METPTLPTPTLPTFFSIFLLIYLSAYFLLFRNWGPKHRPGASSCLISLSHGSAAAAMAAHAILRSHKATTFASPNTATQNTVLEFSIAYFSLDLLHYLIFFPNDVLFILHHLATLYVFTTCRYAVRHGAHAILVLLFLAEITSGCQNAWTLAGFRRSGSPAAAKLYDFLSPKFYAFYSVFRGILGPVFMYKMGAFYVSGAADPVIPIWAWVSWMVVISTAICLSILWVLNLWIDWYKNKVQKKKR
ncbi:TLC domain-containing protein At5g14285-like [Pyrus communis]|uniref:TLC domain-containing protein At5g14285-like n=1 Tax=Pyrus communis TaxID=23211 RepID=UPI0035C202F5